MATLPNRTLRPGRGLSIATGRGFGHHYGLPGGFHPLPGQGGHPPFQGGNPPTLHHPRPPFHNPPGQGGHPPFQGGNPPTLGGTTKGYTGLDQIVQLLQHGINQQQLNNLAAGATGAHGTGAIGGMHGAFSGLSPAAVHWLATSGILQASQPQQQDTTGLSGDDLFKAQLMNSLLGHQAPTYTLHSGVDANFLTNALKTLGGAYAKGYGAGGILGGPQAPGMGQTFLPGQAIPLAGRA